MPRQEEDPAQRPGARNRGTYDLTRLKEIESFSHIEVRMRILAVCGGGLGVAALLRDVPLTIFLGAYCVWLVFALVLIARLPAQVPRWQAWLVGAVYFGLYALLIACAVHLWYWHGLPGQIMALTLAWGIMLNTVSARSEEPILVVAGIVAGACALAFFAADTLSAAEFNADSIALAVTFVLSYAYFLIVAIGISNARAALERTRRSEIESARFEAVGRLAGGVAHDFNNLLTVIIGNLQLRRELQKNGGTFLESELLVREVERAAERAAQTTSRLLAYSRRAMLRPERAGVSSLMSKLKPRLREVLPSSVSLEVDGDRNLPDVEIDIAQFMAVMHGIAMNAGESMPSGGRLHLFVELCGAEIVAPLIPKDQPLREKFVHFRVEDNGIGIPEDILARVTEPFFTTRPVGEASGLGLSMALGFASQSGGALDIDSAPNRGTRVSLYLPAADAPVIPRPEDWRPPGALHPAAHSP